LAKSVRVPAEISEAVDSVNNRQTDRLENLISLLTPRGGIVGILGLSYKPHTPVTEESPATLLIPRLLLDFIVLTYDPLVRRSVTGEPMCESAEECVSKSDTVVVLTDSPEFAKLSVPRHKVLIDPWGIMNTSDTSSDTHIRFGVCNG